ncbi:MAG: flavodoxin family protein [Bacillota bacterium]
MKAVILNGFENENFISQALKTQLEEKTVSITYFFLKDMDIKPCRSCGACGIKSPGRCVINDDMHTIMKGIAQSDIYILLTPIRFGGYSAQLKRALDRTMPLGMPLYIIRDGHMLHPMRYGDKKLMVVGLLEQELKGQEENFRLLVERNAMNLLSSFNSFLILKPSDSTTKVENDISFILKEVIG